MATTSSQPTDTTDTKGGTSPSDTTGSAVLMTEYPTLGERMLLVELQAIGATLSKTSNPIPSQEIWNFLLQFFGILAAIIFGVFSVLAWVDANKANSIANQSNSIASSSLNLAIEANTLALLAYCLSSNDTSTDDICATVRSQAAADITNIVASLPTSVTGGSGGGNGNTEDGNGSNNGNGNVSSPSSPNNSRAATIAGGVVGGISILCCILWLPLQTYKEQLRRNRVVEEQSRIRRAWAKLGQGYRSSPVHDWHSPAQGPRPDRETV